MNKQQTQQPEAAPVAKSLMGAIENAVVGFFKGTRTVESNYSSTSRTTETTDEPAQPDVVIIRDGIDAPKTASAPAAPATPQAAAGTGGVEVISKALASALAPLADAVEKLDSRLATVERQSTGSQAINGNGGHIEVRERREKMFPELETYLKARVLHEYGAGQRLTKAVISSLNWNYGLTIDEANKFLQYVVDESKLMSQIRTIRMDGRIMWIPKIGLGSNVFVKGTPGVDPGDTVSVTNPTQIELISKEIVALGLLSDDLPEDSIEGEGIVDTLMGMFMRQGRNEIERSLIHGDVSVADTGIMDRWDGYYKLAKTRGAHVIEAMADANRFWPDTNGKKATRVLKSIPTKFTNDLTKLRWLLHPHLYLDYSEELASKGYSNAWMAITGKTDEPLKGVQNIQVPLMKTDMSFTYSATPYTDGTFVMLTDMENLILGLTREIKLETQRSARKRANDVVISMRGVPELENADAVGIYDHAKVQS